MESVPATERFHARDLLAKHPHLEEDRSTLLDLAYEEYCQAVEAGETIDPRAFATQFPQIADSLLKLLEVHSFVVGNSLLPGGEREVHWPTAGEVFLGFELLEEIGKGAFARVFLAREMGLGNRQVVVKISQKGAAEATMLGRLDHPNIVPIHSITTDETIDLSALCMPYLGRTTAAEWIQTRFKASSVPRLKSSRHLQSVIEIGKGVCQGLQFAHARHVLHCDIKPSNILITHDGEPLLLDFNLSTNRFEEKHLIGGTLFYMAPEQLHRAQGDRASKITERTDVFCLGATLYQMAAGQLPFPIDGGGNPRLKDVMESALKARRTFSGQSHPLPEPLLSVLKDALAFDPEERIASAKEFYHRLAACQTKLARPRFRWLWPATAAGILVLGIASANRNPGTIPQERPDEPAAGQTDVASEPPPAPASSFPDRLKRANEAHIEGRYAEAVKLYREILESDRNHPDFTEHLGLAVKSSLAFCLLMEREFLEANQYLAELHERKHFDETFCLNQTACLVLLSIGEGKLQDMALMRKAKVFLNRTTASEGSAPELHHIFAILEASLAKMSEGRNREVAAQIAISRTRAALGTGLSKRKAMAIGHILPELKGMPLLTPLITENPRLLPDLDVDVPVRSPLNGKTAFVTITLP